jgi:hypothetical protein
LTGGQGVVEDDNSFSIPIKPALYRRNRGSLPHLLGLRLTPSRLRISYLRGRDTIKYKPKGQWMESIVSAQWAAAAEEKTPLAKGNCKRR